MFLKFRFQVLPMAFLWLLFAWPFSGSSSPRLPWQPRLSQPRPQIGFASKDALSNIIAGLFIFWDRPFVVGDLIENQGYYGRVADITLRSTRVVTPDGKMLAIPNSSIVNSTVASYTNFPNLRLDIPITIGVGEDIGKVRKLLLDMVAGNPAFLTKPAPTLSVDALNDYNLLVTFSVWLEDEKAHVKARADLREAAFEVLRTAAVDMPYETLQLMPMEVTQKRSQVA